MNTLHYRSLGRTGSLTVIQATPAIAGSVPVACSESAAASYAAMLITLRRGTEQAQRAGLWVDGRRAIRTNAFLNELIELAERVPELYALLRKHGHVPPVIRLQADPVIAGELPPRAPSGTGLQHREGEPVAAAEARLGSPDPSGNPPDPAAVSGDSGLTNDVLQQLVRRVLTAVKLCADPSTGLVSDRTFNVRLAGDAYAYPQGQDPAPARRALRDRRDREAGRPPVRDRR